MTNFQVGGSEQTAETCVTPQGSAPNMWERYLRKGPKSVSPSVGELLAHKWCPRGHRASSEPHLGCHRDPSSAKQRSQSFLPGIWAGVSFFFFFLFKSFAEHCWVVRVGEMCQQDFSFCWWWAEHHPLCYTILQGRRRRRRCSLREEEEGKEEEEEEMLPLLLCRDLFSLLQRTWSKREDWSSDHSSTLGWVGSSSGKEHLFSYAGCVFCTKWLLTKIQNLHL